MIPPDTALTTTKRSRIPFLPSSGCTVTTGETAREAELAIRTFQHYHQGKPVYVVADDTAAAHLKTRGLRNVRIEVMEFRKPSTVADHNTYHRSDAILRKMDAMQFAVEQWGDTVFFDADILFLHNLTGGEDSEVVLSHNLPTLEQEAHGSEYGHFNAGLLWTCNPKFPVWWRETYLNSPGFYEQRCLNMVPRLFRTGYFEFMHNYGFWRGPIGRREPKSIHLHLSVDLDTTLLPFMRQHVHAMRKETWNYLARKHPDIAVSARRAVGHPSKIFFCHYGKAAGVYTNEMIGFDVLPDYEHHDSWKQGLNRDWTDEELTKLLREADPAKNHYLHQHHVHITEKHMHIAKQNGWKTFMFVRDPLDLIPALYFWSRETQLKENGVHPVLYDWPDQREAASVSLEDFWQLMLEDRYRPLWNLPEWVNMVDNLDLFSDEAMARMLVSWLGYHHVPGRLKNTSANPGRVALMKAGDFSHRVMMQTLATPDYQKFASLFQGRLQPPTYA